jgi:hypothetical protein
MNNFYALSDDVKKTVLEQTAIKQGLPKQIIEKDLWVSTLLEIIFTLPFSDKLVFKGGTSLSKVWGLISRFSEDIDISIDRNLFGFEGDLTIRQIKKLRKESSLFVNNDFCLALNNAISQYGLNDYLIVESQPNGEGDKTYPEPRQIFIKYKSLFDMELSYIQPQIILEVGARSLFEPTEKSFIQSMITASYPSVETSVIKTAITTAVAAKTFLEKAFLLHELFTTNICSRAERKSRHLYDLERMMDMDFAVNATKNDDLWVEIHHHREIFTRIKDVDYTGDIRNRIVLTPPDRYYQIWASDYANMQSSMIYEKSISFDRLLERMHELENRFKNRLK